MPQETSAVTHRLPLIITPTAIEAKVFEVRAPGSGFDGSAYVICIRPPAAKLWEVTIAMSDGDKWHGRGSTPFEAIQSAFDAFTGSVSEELDRAAALQDAHKPFPQTLEELGLA